LIVTDIRREAAAKVAEELGATLAEPDAILAAKCDVLSPNAMGGILNQDTFPNLKCKVVCGGANNQLATPDDARRLWERGILYGPDYIVNAGGVIQVADELDGYNYDRCKSKVEAIPGLLRQAFKISSDKGIDVDRAATHLVEDRIRRVLELKSTLAPAR
jgi:leucine dehydrogenase